MRDGLVVDFLGAIELLGEMKKRIEYHHGRGLVSASSAYPPCVPVQDTRAAAHILEGVGFICKSVIDQPIAANKGLNETNGAIVDVYGGTTGICLTSSDSSANRTRYTLGDSYS